ALLQSKAQSFPPQDEFEPGSVAAGENPALTGALGKQQSLGFIEPDGTGGDVELPGQFSDAIGSVVHARTGWQGKARKTAGIAAREQCLGFFVVLITVPV